MSKRNHIFNCVIFLTILLWVYTVGSKLADFRQFGIQLHKQPLSKELVSFLLYFLPSIEVLAATLIFFHKTRFMGFCISFGLLLAFTLYVGLVIIKFYGYVPCSCGGILHKMSWRMHFWFNVFFLCITAYGAYFTLHDRRDLSSE